MWAVIKIKTNCIGLLKEDLNKRFKKQVDFYIPKILVQTNTHKKPFNKSISLLGDYIFCYHYNFNNTKFLDQLRFVKGIKYFLNGHLDSQNEIKEFISKCKKLEDKKGFISKNFFELNLKSFYKFKTGLLANKVFQLIEIQKNKIKVLVNGIKVTENKRFLTNP